MDALIAMCEAASYIEVNPSLIGDDKNLARNSGMPANPAAKKRHTKFTSHFKSSPVASMGVLASAAASLMQIKPMHAHNGSAAMSLSNLPLVLPMHTHTAFNSNASPPGTMGKTTMQGLTPISFPVNGKLNFSSPAFYTTGLPLQNFASGGGQQPQGQSLALHLKEGSGKAHQQQGHGKNVINMNLGTANCVSTPLFSPNGKRSLHIANQVLPTPTGKTPFFVHAPFAVNMPKQVSGARKALCAPWNDDKSPTSAMSMSIDTSLPPSQVGVGRTGGAKTPSPNNAMDTPVKSFLEPSAKQKATRSPVRYSYNQRLKRISEHVTQKRLKKSKAVLSSANLRIMKKKVEMELRDRYPTRAKLERAPENPFGLWMAGTNLNGRSGRKKFVAPMKVCDDCGWKSHCRCKSCKNPKCGKVFPVKPAAVQAAKLKKAKKKTKKNKRKASKSFPEGASTSKMRRKVVP